MKRLFAVLLLICVLMLGGCGKSVIYDMPDGVQEIETCDYKNPDDPEDGYCAIEYNGRIYAPYGTQGKTIKDSMIEKCIGYTDGDTNCRVYTLSGTDDYIADYYVNGEMEQFHFSRAVDTVGKEIETPDYIISLDYELWK